MKSKKGFTLVELLGVIIIISFLIIIVFISVIGSIKKSKEKVETATLDMIYNASSIYISRYSNDFPKVEGNKYIISLEDLVGEDLIPSKIKFSGSNENLVDTKCVQITYNEEYEYELKNITECEEISNE